MPFELEEAAPVRLNMTPMIDVVFQLIVFFLCSMEFKSLDWKVETALPKDRGPLSHPIHVDEVPKLTITLRNVAGGATVVKAGGRSLGRLAESETPAVVAAVRGLALAAIERAGGRAGATEAGLLCEIDAGPRVPTGDVLTIADVFAEVKAPKITFTGTPEPRIADAGPAPR